MTQDLTENNQAVDKYNDEIDAELVATSDSLNKKFKSTHELEQKVHKRLDELLATVYDGHNKNSIVAISNQRDQMELSLTEGLLMYNHKVDKQID